MEQSRDETTQARKEIGHLRRDTTQLRADLMERMDRLRNAFTALGEDVRVTTHSGDRVERIARSASEETRALAEVVTGMRRQIQNLQTQVQELRGGP